MKDMIAVWKLEQSSEHRQEAWQVLSSAELNLLNECESCSMHAQGTSANTTFHPLAVATRDGLGDVYSSSGYPLPFLAIGSWACGRIEVERALWK